MTKNFFDRKNLNLFFENYWRQKPLFIKGGAINFLKREFNYDDFFQFAEDIIKVFPQNLRGTPDKVIFIQEVNRVSDFLEKSVYRNKIKFNSNSIWYDLIYAKNGNSIGSHFDHSDNIVLQQKGTKVWRLYDSSIIPFHEKKSRMLNEVGVGHFDMPSTGYQEFILEEGDLLYIPLFWVHQGVSSGESLSLSMVINAELNTHHLSKYIIDICENESDLIYQNTLVKSELQNREYLNSYLLHMANSLSKKEIVHTNKKEIDQSIKLIFDVKKINSFESKIRKNPSFCFTKDFFVNSIEPFLCQFYLSKSFKILDFVFSKSNYKEEIQQFVDFITGLPPELIIKFYQSPIWLYWLNKTEININGRHFLINQSSKWLGEILVYFILTNKLDEYATQKTFSITHIDDIYVGREGYLIKIPSNGKCSITDKIIIKHDEQYTNTQLNLAYIYTNSNCPIFSEISFLPNFFKDLSGVDNLDKGNSISKDKFQNLFYPYYCRLEELNINWLFDIGNFIFFDYEIFNISPFPLLQILTPNSDVPEEFNEYLSNKIMSYWVHSIDIVYPFNNKEQRMKFENGTGQEYHKSLEVVLSHSLNNFLFKTKNTELDCKITLLKEDVFAHTNEENIRIIESILLKFKTHDL